MRAVRFDSMTLWGRKAIMQKTEIRVRPVVRHVVTRFTEERTSAPGEAPAYTRQLETLGEFDNEAQAERVAEALRCALPKPMQYIAVERTFELLTNVLYFEYEEEAERFVKQAMQQGREFRVFSRVITDPMKLALHNSMPARPHPASQCPELPPALTGPSDLMPPAVHLP